MNDTQESAEILRPRLFLLFENQKDLFQSLAAHRLNQAIDSVLSVLREGGEISAKLARSLLAFEKYPISRWSTRPMESS